MPDEETVRETLGIFVIERNNSTSPLEVDQRCEDYINGLKIPFDKKWQLAREYIRAKREGIGVRI